MVTPSEMSDQFNAGNESRERSTCRAQEGTRIFQNRCSTIGANERLDGFQVSQRPLVLAKSARVELSDSLQLRQPIISFHASKMACFTAYCQRRCRQIPKNPRPILRPSRVHQEASLPSPFIHQAGRQNSDKLRRNASEHSRKVPEHNEHKYG